MWCSIYQFVPDKTTASLTFKVQNRIEDTGRPITGMVVTDDDHLLLNFAISLTQDGSSLLNIQTHLSSALNTAAL
jgi:hypothetical protein